MKIGLNTSLDSSLILKSTLSSQMSLFNQEKYSKLFLSIQELNFWFIYETARKYLPIFPHFKYCLYLPYIYIFLKIPKNTSIMTCKFLSFSFWQSRYLKANRRTNTRWLHKVLSVEPEFNCKIIFIYIRYKALIYPLKQ